MAGAKLLMTADEMVAYLKKTRLPTLIVEGSGDKALLRRVEVELQSLQVDILPIGGKDALDRVFSEKASYCNARVEFLRDKDGWVISGVPAGYDDVIFTTGYSIENDVMDAGVVSTLAGTKSASLNAKVAMVSNWFKHAIYADHTGQASDIGRDITSILVGDDYHPEAALEIERSTLGDEYSEQFSKDCWIWLRGKTLLRLIQDHLHKSSPSYSKDQIVDLCIKMGPSMLFVDLVGRIRSRFAES